jgi:hypothetical protein
MKRDYVFLGIGAVCAGPLVFGFVSGQSSPPLGFASTTNQAELNCTSMGLQRAGFDVTRYDEWWGDHRLHFSDDVTWGTATIAKDPAGYLEVTTRTYSHPTKVPLERARVTVRRAYDGVAAACGLGKPREICSRRECAGAKREPPLPAWFKKQADRVRSAI